MVFDEPGFLLIWGSVVKGSAKKPPKKTLILERCFLLLNAKLTCNYCAASTFPHDLSFWQIREHDSVPLQQSCLSWMER